ESGLSCLDYLMQGEATVPPDLGILLNVSWRMHPAVCSFISDAVYEGRLLPQEHTKERYLVLSPTAHPALRPAGLRVVESPHTGCTHSSVEEAEVVAELLT